MDRKRERFRWAEKEMALDWEGGGGCYSGVTKTGEMHFVCTAPGGRKPKIGLNSN